MDAIPVKGPPRQKDMLAQAALARKHRLAQGYRSGDDFYQYRRAKFLKRTGAFHRLNEQAIQQEQRELRKLVMAGDISNPAQDKLIKKQVRKIALLYAVDAMNGDVFRKNVSMAADLAGWKRLALDRARDRAAKRRARNKMGAELTRREKLLEAEAQADGQKDHTF